MTDITYNTPQSTFNILSNRLIVDMANTIYLLEPNAAPLTTLLSKLKKRSCANTRFDWIKCL